MALGGGFWISMILGLFFLVIFVTDSIPWDETHHVSPPFGRRFLDFFQPPNSRKSNDSRHSLSHSTFLQALNSTNKFPLPLFFFETFGLVTVWAGDFTDDTHDPYGIPTLPFFLKLIWIIHSLDKPSTFGRYLWILGARQGLLDAAVLHY